MKSDLFLNDAAQTVSLFVRIFIYGIHKQQNFLAFIKIRGIIFWHIE